MQTPRGDFMHQRWLLAVVIVPFLFGAGAAPAPAQAPAAESTVPASKKDTKAPPKKKPRAAAEKPAAAATPPPESVTLNFVNAELEGVVKAVSEITGKNFLVDPRVKGTVNVVSARPMSRGQVYDVFLSALRMQGFATVEDRGIVRIVPEGEAKLLPSPMVGPGEKARASGEQIVTKVFALKHESASQLVPVLRPLIAPNNTITAYANSNTIVVTDYASNVQRIERIVETIDRPGGTDPVVIPLRYASAVDVAQTVSRMFAEPPATNGAAAEPSQKFTVLADSRSNALLVRSGDPARLARVRSLVSTIDSPNRAGGNIHVVYLKNADAMKVAETLRGIYQGDSTQSARRPSQSSPSLQPVTAATPVQGAANPPPAAASAPAYPASAGPQVSGGATAGQGQNAEQVSILADATTNAVIITAPDPVYNNLRAVLEKLDARRAQVYVEALIAEVSATKAAEFGIQWQDLSAAGAPGSGARGFGGTNFGTGGQNILNVARSPTAAGRGLNIGILHGQVSIPGVTGAVLSLNALVRALETDGNANILSTPTLLTLDNEEARIVIGQNVPFITGQYALTGAATTPTPFQTIERRDVGLTLRIRPQISAGGSVRLQIYQEVSSVQDSANAAGVITNKRAVESSVLVDDGRIVVIGGLIQDSVNDGVEKVPLLGDIPVLGGLFKYSTRSRTKTNLMVFLRPTLVRDADGADPLTNERYDYILGEQRSVKPAQSPVLPDMDGPTLPQRKPPPPRPDAAPKP
jgi:general secretion pathway protein D